MGGKEEWCPVRHNLPLLFLAPLPACTRQKPSKKGGGDSRGTLSVQLPDEE